MTTRKAWALATAAALAACGGEDATPAAAARASCNKLEATGVCSDYVNPPADPDIPAMCVDLEMGVWSDESCPTLGRTGTCAWYEGDGFYVYDRYYDAVAAPADAQGCTGSGGSWTAG